MFIETFDKNFDLLFKYHISIFPKRKILFLILKSYKILISSISILDGKLTLENDLKTTFTFIYNDDASPLQYF